MTVMDGQSGEHISSDDRPRFFHVEVAELCA